MVQALKIYKQRKFLVGNSGYFKIFLDAYPEMKADVERLIKNGQLVILNGASIASTDEASTYFADMTTSVQMGAKWFMDTFPNLKNNMASISWMIDAFGHSLGNLMIQSAAGMD